MATSERDLVESIIKAVSNDETAPKQKHVRVCIVFSHQAKSSHGFWSTLKLQPLLHDEVVCFKALITIHKLLRDGHPAVLRESLNEETYLKTLANPPMRSRAKGYLDLIQSYVRFLLIKLEFHRTHPEFSGNMSYDDYVSLRRANNPNEGYTTVIELMQLQTEVLALVANVFASFRKNLGNECRISALVPLVEESYGIYEFITSMLRAMHAVTDDISVYEELRDKYNKQYYQLYKFYYDASALRYLTSLIAIPSLDPDPPALYDANARPRIPARAPQAALPAPQPVADDSALIARLQALQQQHDNDSLTIANLVQRISALEAELAMVKALLFEEQHKNAELTMHYAQLKEEYDALKSKFDKLSGMYGTMRTDHIALLKQKQDFVEKNKRAAEIERELNELRKSRATESLQLTDEAARLRRQLADAERTKAEELAALKAQLTATNAAIEELSQSKGAEVENIVKQYNADRAKAEQEREAKAAEMERLRAELERFRAESARQTKAMDEDVSVLRATLDHALRESSVIQNEADARARALQAELDALRDKQSNEMNGLLDDMLDASRTKIEESVFQFDSPLHAGNQNATADYTLAHLDKITSSVTDLSNTLMNLKDGKGTPTAVMGVAGDAASAADQLLQNVKGLTRSLDDAVAEPISNAARSVARSMQDMLHRDTTNLAASRAAAQSAVEELTRGLESVAQTNELPDVSDRVEQEMLSAAQAIEAAAARLSALLNAPSADTSAEYKVNTAILESVMGITGAIGNLIRAATLAQQEIVAKGRGSASAQQFYKKNHRWTEGLVSAAKAVAMCTTTLVENADGVVKGTHTMEQLVVAAHEVSAATAQLVAASRVKADKNSRTQANLETAAKTVSEATKLLVKAAKEAAAKKLEGESRRQIAELTVGQRKRRDMEQQVKILTLEKELTNARKELSDMRKSSYHAGNDELGEEATTPKEGTLAPAVAQAAANLGSAVGPAVTAAKPKPPPIKPKPTVA